MATKRMQISQETISRFDAVRFLNRTTFGANEATIVELQSKASYEAWIDDQLQLPISLTQPYVRATSNGSLRTTRHHIWWQNALTGADQLRQRLAFAWSQLFVVSDTDYILGNSQYGMCDFYDMLAVEATGNFRTLLEGVTLHPVMGVYLSMVRNEKADPERNVRPDENFAREILQLFTIGLYQLEPDGQVKSGGGEPLPAYDQSTIEEFAKVFTGWDYADSTAWGSNQEHDRTIPMVANQEFHDTSAKRLLDGQQLPAGRSAEEDLGDAVDIIFNHPNVGPFVGTALIKRLVTSNPTPEYVGRVAAVFDDDGSGTRGNLEALTKAVLLDPEANTGHVTLPEIFGKVKEPVLRLSQLWRAFDAVPGSDADGVYTTRVRPVDGLSDILGQAVLMSPTVFNFYLPNNPLDSDSDLVSPEKQILSEINVASTNNMLFSQIYDHNNLVDAPANQTTINVDREIALAEEPDALITHLEELLLGRVLPSDYRAALAQQIGAQPTTAEGLRDRALDAIFCVIGSPYHYVQL